MRKITKYLPGEKYGKLTIIEEAERYISPLGLKIRQVKCRCECGNETIVITTNLGSGLTISCGKEMCAANRKYHPQITSAREVYSKTYKDGNLTFEEFLELSQQNCYYCDAVPDNKHNKAKYDCGSKFAKNNGDFKYNGLDRVDNDLPHNKDNVVPCCKICNRSKDIMSIKKFKEWITKIYNNWAITENSKK